MDQRGPVDLFGRSRLLHRLGLLQPVLPLHVRRQEVHPPLQELHLHPPPTGSAIVNSPTNNPKITLKQLKQLK